MISLGVLFLYVLLVGAWVRILNTAWFTHLYRNRRASVKDGVLYSLGLLPILPLWVALLVANTPFLIADKLDGKDTSEFWENMWPW